MRVDRKTLAEHYHKAYCTKKEGCDGTPDHDDYDMADLANEILEDVPASAVTL